MATAYSSGRGGTAVAKPALARRAETLYRRSHMPTITNKTTKPLSVPLPGGKTVHLGPKASGQVSPRAAEHAPLQKLVEAGALAVVAGGAGGGQAVGGGAKGQGYAQGGPVQGRGSPRRGDR